MLIFHDLRVGETLHLEGMGGDAQVTLLQKSGRLARLGIDVVLGDGVSGAGPRARRQRAARKTSAGDAGGR